MKYIITERQLKLINESDESENEVFPKGNIAYHITPDIFLNDVEQVGLVPKSESKLSYHPDRIYLFMNPEMDKEMTNVLWNATSKEKQDIIKDYYVLQIDLTQIPNHKFYMDRDSSFSYVAIFTSEPIPSSAIKVIKKIPSSELKKDLSPEEQKQMDDDYEKVMAQMRNSLGENILRVKEVMGLITENQLLSEQTEEVLKLPNIEYFGGWDGLQEYLSKKNNPPYSIEDELNLADSNVTSLGNLVSVKGNLHLNGSKIESLGNLTRVGGNLVLSWTKLKSLGNLTHIGGYADLLDSKIESLGNLTRIDGELLLTDTKKIKSLGNLTYVGSHVYLDSSNVKSLGNLTEVGGVLELFNSKVTNLDNLTSVGINLNARGAGLNSLGNLNYVGGNLDLRMTNVENFGNLKKVGGNLDLGGCNILLNYKSPKKIRSIVDVAGTIKTKL